MHVLCVTPMYPEPTNPAFGSFVAHLNRGLERHAGMRIDVIRRRAGRRGLMSYVGLVRAALRRVQRRDRYDLVVGHYLGPSAGIATTMARGMRVPLVLTAHGSDIEAARQSASRMLIRQVVQQANGLHLVSRDLEQRAEQLLGALPERRLIQSMGVDLERFVPEAGPEPRARTRKRILVVAHLIALKGWDDMVAAVARLAADGLDVELVGYGGGDSGWVNGLAEQHGVSDRVRLRGICAPEVLPEIYRDSDAVLVASHREGFGLVGLEAMACGRPLVATAAGGPMDYLVDGDNAIVVSPGDIGGLAEALRRVLDEPETARRLAENGMKTVQRFGVDRAASNVADFYRRVVAES